MEYKVIGTATALHEATFAVRSSVVSFGIKAADETLANPAELFLGAFAACCLKNVERFSKILKFDYDDALIEVIGKRQDAPPQLTAIRYVIQIKSKDEHLNAALLHKNIQRYGTIYNTLKATCEVSGELKIIKDYV